MTFIKYISLSVSYILFFECVLSFNKTLSYTLYIYIEMKLAHTIVIFMP